MQYSQLPLNSLGGGDNDSGCLGGVASLIVFILLVITLVYTYEGNSSNNETQRNEPAQTVTPTPVYQQPVYYPPTHAETAKAEPTPEPQKDEAPAAVQPIHPTVTISKYYEKGYDKGYDDGEDDAVMGNGWGGQFDDTCPYKGQACKDYQLGYEEGYEAGYDDNNEGED